jgi:hypothetical protein
VDAYCAQGGAASIFVNDDGLQLLGPEAQLARIRFYRQHNVGYVARPPHSAQLPGGFRRAGRFKKASNLNYCLAASERVSAVYLRACACMFSRLLPCQTLRLVGINLKLTSSPCMLLDIARGSPHGLGPLQNPTVHAWELVAWQHGPDQAEPI